MIDVLGLPLDLACERLKAEGKPVRLVEVRSKKGGKGSDRRVIKMEFSDSEITIFWSAFQTSVGE